MFNKFNIKSKNIPIIYFSTLISGFNFFLPILALYFEKNLFSVTNVALIFAIEAICICIFEIPTGTIADLLGRRKTLILSKLIEIMGLILLYIGGNIVVFILFAIFTSISKSLVSGTDTSLIFDTLKNENKEHSYKKIGGIYYTLWPFGASIGSIIGGYLATISLSFPILITFIPVLISTILTFFLKEPYYKKELNKNVFKHISKSLKEVINNKQLIILMLGGFILLTFGEIPHLLMSLFLQFKEIPFEFFGWISAFIFGFSSLGHYFSHNLSEKIGNKRTLFIATFGCILFVFLATIFSKYISAILFVIPSLFFGLRNPIITHLLHLEVNSNNRATIISIYNSLGQLGLAIFFPVMGYLTDLYSINTTFKISALLMIIAPISYLFLKNRK